MANIINVTVDDSAETVNVSVLTGRKQTVILLSLTFPSIGPEIKC